MKRRIVCEIDVPEDFDACWQDGCGVQAFHDTIICGISQLGMDKIIEFSTLEKSDKEQDIQFAQYLRTKHKVRKSLKMVGYIDENNQLKEYE
jgi:hypothetical protein